MTHFLLPFFLALSIHGLMLQLTWEQKQVQQPEAGGERSIVIAIEQIQVPQKQHQVEPKPEPEPRQTRVPPQPKTLPVDVEKRRESLSQPQLSEPAQVQIKPAKHKIVRKSPKTIPTSVANTQVRSLQEQLQQHTEPSAFSDLSHSSKTSKQKISSITAKPLYQQNQKPPYPPLARRRNWQGTVLLLVTVDVQGLSKNVQILEGSGYSILDKTAKKTVQKWKFTPGKINGRPTEMQVQVPIHFKLE
jgi:periplasmic protein TonB